MSFEPDYSTVPGQVYACLSYVGPDAPQKCDHFGIKIRGCFPDKDSAAAHAKRLQREDATFNIYIVDMYQWLHIPPPNDIDDVHYSDEKLEELMSAHRENQALAAKMFRERKQDMVAQPAGDSDTPFIKPGDVNSQYYTKPELPPALHPADVFKELQEEHPDLPVEELVRRAEQIVLESQKKNDLE